MIPMLEELFTWVYKSAHSPFLTKVIMVGWLFWEEKVSDKSLLLKAPNLVAKAGNACSCPPASRFYHDKMDHFKSLTFNYYPIPRKKCFPHYSHVLHAVENLTLFYNSSASLFPVILFNPTFYRLFCCLFDLQVTLNSSILMFTSFFFHRPW